MGEHAVPTELGAHGGWPASRWVRLALAVLGAGAAVLFLAACDTTPPGPVTGLTPSPSASSVTLTWSNPADADYAGAVVRVAVGSTPPATRASGALVADVATPGTSVVASGLAPSTTYSFSVFAHDKVPNDAPAVTATVNTASSGLTCTKDWSGPSGGSFATAANWTPAGVPASTDTICSGAGTSIASSASPTVAGAELRGTLTLTAGTFTISGTANPNTVANLVLSGGLQAGDLSVSSSLVWTTGGFSGSGTTTLGAAATGSFTFGSGGGQVNGTHVFRNAGTVTQNVASSYLYPQTGAVVRNAGTWTVLDTGYMASLASGSPSLVNEPTGTLIINPGSGNTTILNVAFANQGTVTLSSGTLNLSAGNPVGVTDTGAMTVSSGATLQVSASRTVDTSAVVSGAGTLALTTGTTTFNGSHTVANLVLSGGLQAGDLSVSSSLVWTAGGFSGSGTTTLGAAATGSFTFGSGGGQVNGTHVFRNAGTVTQNVASSYLYPQTGAVVRNAGTWTVLDTGYMASLASGSPSLVNEPTGTLIINPGSGNTATLNLITTNDGTIAVQSGTFVLSPTLTNLSGSTLTGGTYVLTGAMKLPTSGSFTTNGSNLTLNGTGVLLSSTGVDLAPGISTNSGSLTLNGGLTPANPFANSGSVTIGAGTFAPTSYTQSGGSTTVAAGAVLAPSSGDVALNGGTLAGSGTVAASVTGAGSVSPGTGPGVAGGLTVTGSWAPTAASVLAVEVPAAGVAGTAYDQLSVSGPAALGGTLAITTPNGFVPSIGQTFTVLTYGSRTGAFATITGRRPVTGLYYDVIYSATSVTLVVRSVPSAPTMGSATAGTGQATVTWTAPASDGGAAITAYVVTPYIGAVAQPTVTFQSTATTEVIAGLTGGVTYTFKVAAINRIGTGAQSAASNPVTPT